MFKELILLFTFSAFSKTAALTVINYSKEDQRVFLYSKKGVLLALFKLDSHEGIRISKKDNPLVKKTATVHLELFGGVDVNPGEKTPKCDQTLKKKKRGRTFYIVGKSLTKTPPTAALDPINYVAEPTRILQVNPAFLSKYLPKK